jgi:hypothetical protein
MALVITTTYNLKIDIVLYFRARFFFSTTFAAIEGTSHYENVRICTYT